MITVDSISTAGIVHVVFLVSTYQSVVNGIFKTAEIDCNTVLISFGSMVIDNIKNYFETSLVHFAYQGLEFIYNGTRSLVCSKRSFWGKEIYRAVSPIILHSLTSSGIDVGIFIFIKIKNWQKLNCSNSQILKIWNLFCESGKSTRMLDTGILSCSKSLYVNFIYDAF